MSPSGARRPRRRGALRARAGRSAAGPRDSGPAATRRPPAPRRPDRQQQRRRNHVGHRHAHRPEDEGNRDRGLHERRRTPLAPEHRLVLGQCGRFSHTCRMPAAADLPRGGRRGRPSGTRGECHLAEALARERPGRIEQVQATRAGATRAGSRGSAPRSACARNRRASGAPRSHPRPRVRRRTAGRRRSARRWRAEAARHLRARGRGCRCRQGARGCSRLAFFFPPPPPPPPNPMQGVRRVA